MYIVEGNIGVGKSTFLTLIKQLDPGIDIILEPKDNWANRVYGQSLLANFYQDPSRWAYTLETLAMVCRTRDHIKEQKHLNQRRILERSIYSGHYVFAKNDYANGYLSDLEWEIYERWASFLIKEKCQPPHGFIYLKADPETCFKRVKKRNRLSEKKLTVEYIQQIDDWHEKFLVKKEDLFESIQNVPILTLNCNEDFVAHKSVMEKHVAEVKSFFTKAHHHQPSVLSSHEHAGYLGNASKRSISAF